MTLQIVLIDLDALLPPPDIVLEFERLMTTLDRGIATRSQWDRFKAILTIATLEASDTEAGRAGYARMLGLWRNSMFYDGED